MTGQDIAILNVSTGDTIVDPRAKRFHRVEAQAWSLMPAILSLSRRERCCRSSSMHC